MIRWARQDPHPQANQTTTGKNPPHSFPKSRHAGHLIFCDSQKERQKAREREGRLTLPFNVLEHHTRFERSNLSNLHWSQATKSIFLRLPASSPLSFFIFIFSPLLLHRMDKTRSKAWLVPLRAGTNRGGPSTSPQSRIPSLELSFLFGKYHVGDSLRHHGGGKGRKESRKRNNAL